MKITQRIGELEDRVIEMIQFKENNETTWTEPQRSVGHNCTNIHVIRVSEGCGRESQKKKIWRNMWNFPKFNKNIYLHIGNLNELQVGLAQRELYLDMCLMNCLNPIKEKSGKQDKNNSWCKGNRSVINNWLFVRSQMETRKQVYNILNVERKIVN